MLDFCKERYSMLEEKSKGWKKSKTFDENCKKCFDGGNPGRSFDESVDLTEALKDHYNPKLALKKLKEVHDWLKRSNTINEDQREERGWQKAYSLTPWKEFPGDITVSAVIGGRLCTMAGLATGTGPSTEAQVEAKTMRELVRSCKTK